MAGSRFAHVHGHLFRSSTFLESFRASGRTRTLRLAQALSRTTRIQFFNAGRSGRKFTLSPPLLPLHSEPPHSPSHIKLIFGLPAPTADSGPGRDPSSGSNGEKVIIFSCSRIMLPKPPKVKGYLRSPRVNVWDPRITHPAKA